MEQDFLENSILLLDLLFDLNTLNLFLREGKLFIVNGRLTRIFRDYRQDFTRPTFFWNYNIEELPARSDIDSRIFSEFAKPPRIFAAFEIERVHFFFDNANFLV